MGLKRKRTDIMTCAEAFLKYMLEKRRTECFEADIEGDSLTVVHYAPDPVRTVITYRGRSVGFVTDPGVHIVPERLRDMEGLVDRLNGLSDRGFFRTEQDEDLSYRLVFVSEVGTSGRRVDYQVLCEHAVLGETRFARDAKDIADVLEGGDGGPSDVPAEGSVRGYR